MKTEVYFIFSDAAGYKLFQTKNVFRIVQAMTDIVGTMEIIGVSFSVRLSDDGDREVLIHFNDCELSHQEKVGLKNYFRGLVHGYKMGYGDGYSQRVR